MEFFYNHDRIHVVFGCDTSIADEFKADFWTLFGTDMQFTQFINYIKSPEIIAFQKELKAKAKRGYLNVDKKGVLTSALTSPIRIFLHTRKMKKKWPWKNHAEYLDKSLKSIREEFGIQVLN